MLHFNLEVWALDALTVLCEACADISWGLCKSGASGQAWEARGVCSGDTDMISNSRLLAAITVIYINDNY